MKTICFTTMIAVFMLLFTNGLQAQTTQPKLDQLKLWNAFIGTWQQVISKDTIQISETQKYGNAFVGNVYLVVNGKKTFQFGITTVYSPKEDNFKGFWFYPNGSYSTLIGSYTAENKVSYNLNQDEILSKAKNIFDDLGSMKNEIKAIANQLDVYRLALKKEEESINLYQKNLSEATDEDTKRLFEYLIKQEKDHYAVIDQLVLLVNHSEEWVEAAEFGLREEY